MEGNYIVNDDTEEKIYSCFDAADSELLKLEKEFLELEDKIELLIPPDDYKKYLDIYRKKEELEFQIKHLEYMKIYKKALKEGLLMGVDLDV